jgi:hypothetical protein
MNIELKKIRMISLPLGLSLSVSRRQVPRRRQRSGQFVTAITIRSGGQ